MTGRILVTGTGRCGTAWAAQVLGIGHQAIFRHQHTLGQPWDWGAADGDSSFEAVPLLPQIRPTVDRIILLVRHPADVVASWLTLGAFKDDMRARWGLFSSVLDIHHPTILTETDPIVRAGRYWHDWNIAALPYATHVLRLEDTDWRRLGEVANREPRRVTGRVNEGLSHETKVSLGVLPEETQQLARRWGYQ